MKNSLTMKDLTSNADDKLNQRNNIKRKFRFNRMGDFKEWIADFMTDDVSYWWITKDEKIIWSWLDYARGFTNWVATFQNNKKWWWVNKDWTVIAYWFDTLEDFKDWFAYFEKDKVSWKISLEFMWWYAIFTRPNWSQGWVRNDWTILIEWFSRCDNFKDWFARFETEDYWNWYVNADWKIFKEIEKNWEIYLEKKWKFFLKKLLIKEA